MLDTRKEADEEQSASVIFRERSPVRQPFLKLLHACAVIAELVITPHTSHDHNELVARPGSLHGRGWGGSKWHHPRGGYEHNALH